MERLSATLRDQIEKRPTKTLLRSSSPQADMTYSMLPRQIPKVRIPVPKNFDGRKVWAGLLSPVKNQGQCGSCWAFATTSCLADQFNIQTMGQINIDLSPTKLILCDWQGKEFDITKIQAPGYQQQLANAINAEAAKTTACTGNTLMDSWRYLLIAGTPEEKCVPYTLRAGIDKPISEYSSAEKLPLCSDITTLFGDMCINFEWDPRLGLLSGTPARSWRAYRYYMIPGVRKDGGKIEYIMENLYKWGPVTTGMKVYPDYYTFDAENEIYEWNGEGPQVGGHAISLVGWGEDRGEKYWWVKNSWGENWGVKGYFRMVRGINNCEIEENVMTGAPDFFYPLGFKHEPDTEFGELDIVPMSQLQQRLDEDTGINVVAAGIEPTTGYSRKAMAKLPGFDFSAPIKLSELPDFMKFIAGIDATEGQRTKFWQSIKSIKKTEFYENKSNTLVIVLLSVCLFIILVVSVSFVLMYRRKR